MDKNTLIKYLKNISKDNIPDLLVLIPAIGVPISIGTKLIIGGLNTKAECDAERSNEELNKQISKIEEFMNKLGVEEVLSQIKNAVLDEFDRENKYDLVYISGLTIMFPDGDQFSEAEYDFFDKLLSGQEINDQIDKEDKINTFMETHCHNADYVIFEDRLYINFDTEDMLDAEKTLGLRDETILFIDMINKIRTDMSRIFEFKFY